MMPPLGFGARREPAGEGVDLFVRMRNTSPLHAGPEQWRRHCGNVRVDMSRHALCRSVG
jgi:hypothetical protein